MESATQLSSRFKEVYLNGKWVAQTNFKEQLANVEWEQAIYKIGSLNTLADLTFHVNYYIAGLVAVFEGGTLDIKDKFSFDTPEVDSEEKWRGLREELMANAEKFAVLVARMPDEQLELPFVKEEYGSFRRNIEAMIEHGYYHLGQIALIKKLISAY